MKKDARIEIRINEDLKNQFIEYANSIDKKISDILRDYIEECCKWQQN